MLRMQAAIVCLKLVSYTLLPILIAVTANGVRESLLVQSAQAGFDLVMLENRIWQLFPVILVMTMSSALLIEVQLPLSLGACWCTLDVNAAGQSVSPVVEWYLIELAHALCQGERPPSQLAGGWPATQQPDRD